MNDRSLQKAPGVAAVPGSGGKGQELLLSGLQKSSKKGKKD
ncbi:hypothetical protein [Borreliella bavariensis]|nr:hypothetical protein [Borreliella bavariensis]